MVRKSIKVIGKIIKGYVILDVICLAIIGIGELIETYKNEPEESVIELDAIAFSKSIEKIKNSFLH